MPPIFRRLRAHLLVAAMALGACAGSEDSSAQLRQRCTDVRDHVAAVRVARLGPATKDNPLSGEIAKHQNSMRAALGTAYIERCEDKGDAFADCMLRASSHDDLAACDKGTK